MNKSIASRLMRSVVVATGLALWAATASADIVFQLGNNPQPDEINIFFGGPESGTTITGEIDSTGIGINFSSPTGQTLDQKAKGQASISTDDNNGALTSMLVEVPGFTFLDFILNLQNGTGDATVTVVDNVSHMFTYTLGNGQNFLTITAINGESISSILVSAPDGFEVFKQPRISGVCNGDGCVAASVPEPQTLALMGLGLLSFVLIRRQRRS